VATAAPAPADLVAGFIGAGSFAQSYLLPNVRSGGAALAAVVTGTGLSARNVAAKFGFGVAATDPAAVLADPAITTVFVATRHDSHARYVRECLQAGKHVFVEKPLALDEEELAQVSDLYGELSEKSKAPLLMVGFNRRFSPLAVKAREHFQGIGEPLVLQFRVNAGFIPPEHWTQQPAIGGGRIIGEVCHFIDLMQYLTGALPVGVHAACIGTDSARLRAEDNLAVTVRLADGSVGSLVYAAGGDKALAKERLEIFGGSLAFVIDDFREGTLYRNNRAERLRLPGKGHREEVAAFLTAVREGLPAPIPFTSLRATTLATFRIRDSLRTGLPQEVGL
jgi:polar amino acid transport system substrate-binding protein